jgi:hypothetical protein
VAPSAEIPELVKPADILKSEVRRWKTRPQRRANRGKAISSSRLNHSTFQPDYREYYKIKRNNSFASIQGFPEMWQYYTLLDAIWLREFSDLKPPGNVNQWFPLILFLNAHAKIRISIELAFSGCSAEARSILRDGIEFVAHAHRMLADPQLQTVRLSKNEDQQAFSDAFERHKRDGLFKGLEELHLTWGQLSESGSHATLNAICDRFVNSHPPTRSLAFARNCRLAD